jgi:hypothetical protein
MLKGNLLIIIVVFVVRSLMRAIIMFITSMLSSVLIMEAALITINELIVIIHYKFLLEIGF